MFEKRNYFEIVLTGGPCAGKSSSLAHIADELAQRGIETLRVPEVATLLMTTGVPDLGTMYTNDLNTYNGLQEQIILMQRSLRQRYREIAAALAPKQVVIIYDRAECDARSYMSEEVFQNVMARHGLTMLDVRDSYDAVIHLVTAAIGAEEAYTNKNNPARYESLKEARSADRRTLQAWIGHHHLKIVDNTESFDDKLRRVFKVVANVIGIPAPVELERWFLLENPPDMSREILKRADVSEITQTYLYTDDPNVEKRVRERRWPSSVSYTWTQKVSQEGMGRVEYEAVIDKSQYLRLLSEADNDHRPLRKRRYCFAHENIYCELDHFYGIPGHSDIWLLEVELIEEGDTIQVPDFLGQTREVSEDPTYSSARIAKLHLSK